MRSVLFAALMAASAAIASDDPFLKGDDLRAEVEKNCSEGCITFNHAEAATFEDSLAKLIAKKQAEAFAAGVRYQAQSCASLI